MPPLAVRVVLLPLHIVNDGFAVIVGSGFTVTVLVAIAAQPLVTVYVVVVDGVATTTGPVVVFNPVDGLHIYVLAPLAVNVVLFPLQIDIEVGVTLMVTEGE